MDQAGPRRQRAHSTRAPCAPLQAHPTHRCVQQAFLGVGFTHSPCPQSSAASRSAPWLRHRPASPHLPLRPENRQDRTGDAQLGALVNHAGSRHRMCVLPVAAQPIALTPCTAAQSVSMGASRVPPAKRLFAHGRRPRQWRPLQSPRTRRRCGSSSSRPPQGSLRSGCGQLASSSFASARLWPHQMARLPAFSGIPHLSAASICAFATCSSHSRRAARACIHRWTHQGGSRGSRVGAPRFRLSSMWALASRTTNAAHAFACRW